MRSISSPVLTALADAFEAEAPAVCVGAVGNGVATGAVPLVAPVPEAGWLSDAGCAAGSLASLDVAGSLA
ncbi:hypothetical protein J5277_23390 [Rhizobium sp. 16-449-1b]|uniref:hypothetical protein n=1 Tax=Rhizobium sp. 16-449-1b TaxID=2819989 RepID=UPI001ADAD1CD|nr:hypothetical protein [Rhizobium sp. 16-449-1b]MBO9197061.1 hypothetical protein [Rhizobium sp. 16-449-1b]